MGLVDPPLDDTEAKMVLEVAYVGLLGEPIEPFSLGIAQAIGLMEGRYGKWGPGNASNNWGAITVPPLPGGGCPTTGFPHKDSSFELGEYTTCFRLYPTSLEGATNFLKVLYVDRPKVFEAALSGDIRGVAREMYATNYYLGTAPPDKRGPNGDFVNVNNYIDFIGKGINQISDLYPFGNGDSDTGNGVVIALGVAAMAGLVMVASK
jgi:hypothetical protein